jgi:hypothetical protein
LVIEELELVNEIVCETAVVLPGANTKLSEFGFAEMGLAAPVVPEFSVTGTEMLVVPAKMLIKPAWAPAVAVPADAVTTRGVVPVCGVTVSQFVSEYAVTVTVCGPLDDVIRIVCTGVVTPV